ncbi:hypothetical protein J6590_016091 [Homalodisca vitripennis]|nr:hypothetical protein J6590_016091 [Homalodisca vitripennis]
MLPRLGWLWGEAPEITARQHTNTQLCAGTGQVPVTLCTLGVGATFGESILQDLPRESTVITRSTCELLRVEQHDFRLIWELREKYRKSGKKSLNNKSEMFGEKS